MTAVPGQPTPDQFAIMDELASEIRAEMEAEAAAEKAAKEAANRMAADDINAHLPCRVEVVRHESDADWERTGHRIDEGRIGWVRNPIRLPASAYVEDLTPANKRDWNPTRLHQPRHLRRLTDDRPR